MKNIAGIMLLIILALFCTAAVVTYPPEKEYDFIRNLKVRNIVDTNGNDLATLKTVYDVRDYGAVGDGTTNDTVAVQAAYDAALAAGGGKVYFPTGRYICELVLDDEGGYTAHGTNPGISGVSLEGENPDTSRLQAVTAGHFAITMTGAGNFYPTVIRNLTFDGNGRTCGGVDANDESASGFTFENCIFWECTYGFRNYGYITWTFNNCTFERNSIGSQIEGKAVMHGGCVVFNDCKWYLNQKAGLYIDGSVYCPEQISIHGGIMEENAFHILADGWARSFPLWIEDVYFENGGLDAWDPVTIGGKTYQAVSAAGLRFDNCWRVNIVRCNNGYELMDVNDSTVIVDNSYVYNSGDPNCTNGGSVTWQDCYFVSGQNQYSIGRVDGWVEYLVAGTQRFYCRRPIIQNYDYAKTNLFTGGSMATSFALSDANSMTYSFVDGNALNWGKYLKLRLQPGTDGYDGVRIFSSPVNVVANKYYVNSYDIKSDTNDIDIRWTDLNGGVVWGYPKVSASKWRRFYGVCQLPTSGDAYYYLFMWNPEATYETVHVANMQLVEFDTREEALRFINEGRYAVTGSGIPQVAFDLDSDANLPGDVNAAGGFISKNGSTSAGYVDLYEDSDDGTNKVRLSIGALPGDQTWTWVGLYTGTFDPNNLAADANDIGTIAATGAALGDFVHPAAPYDLQGITATAYVSATNVVKIKLHNTTTGAINLASGTWRVKVER